MSKPILIDALHIHMSGALGILNHLINHLVIRNVDFSLLKDARCPKLQSEDKIRNIFITASSIKVRDKFYREHKNDFSAVLCLGNIPPTIKLNVPVHTYFHNVSLLKIPKDYPLIGRILLFLKRSYIRFYAKNTDSWIVQTEYTAELVKRKLPSKRHPILLYPFYYIPKNHVATTTVRSDYVFIGEYTYAKGHKYLVDAWIKLAKQGFKVPLHLTVSFPPFLKVIEEAQRQGVPIVNHGFVSFSEVLALYDKSKAIIYPSLNESLGLGIVEAIESGCDVIGCNLPYLYSVCNPSVTFEPSDSDSIVKAVLRYENNEKNITQLKMKDMVEEFIDFLLSSSRH